MAGNALLDAIYGARSPIDGAPMYQGGPQVSNALADPRFAPAPQNFLEYARRTMDPQTPNEMMAANVVRGFTESPAAVKPVRAYHAAYEPFDQYDWSRLGQTTAPNVSGIDEVERWAMNLAHLGPWANSAQVSSKMAAKVDLPVTIGGRGRNFGSLDALEAAIRRAGGPEALRSKLTQQGYGHVAVPDAEMGGRSFIALAPEHFTVGRK